MRALVVMIGESHCNSEDTHRLSSPMLNLNSSLLLLAGLLAGGSISRVVSSSALEEPAARLEALQGKVDAIQQAQWQHGLRHALVDHDAAKHAIELTMARVRCSEWSAERSRVEVRGIIDSVLLRLLRRSRGVRVQPLRKQRTSCASRSR